MDPGPLIVPHIPLHGAARVGQEGKKKVIQAWKPLDSHQQKWGVELGRGA